MSLLADNIDRKDKSKAIYLN